MFLHDGTSRLLTTGYVYVTHAPITHRSRLRGIMAQNIGRTHVCVNDNARFKNLCVIWKHILCLCVCRYDMNPCGIS